MSVLENSAQNDLQEGATLQLHKEELQVKKQWVKTADVSIYTNTYIEEKQITVPVTHEELIIETKKVHHQDDCDGKMETIRIPLSEERIEITKHPMILEDVDIYKKQFEEILQVNELLKEEKLHIDMVGELRIIENDHFS